DLSGAPAVALRSADSSVDLGEIPVTPTASGTYAADVSFPTAGRWEVQVSIRVDEFTSPVTTLEVNVDR
ncbi:MAG: FixH family protein, partial [Nocardioidaceae bacterium]|nr:FixH family protein [Nocardioidaceae bacterium]